MAALVFVAGCGAGVTHTNTRGSSSAAGRSGTSAMAGGATGPLAFAECMRANGVPTFPDPTPGGGPRFVIPAGSDPAAPAFRAAQAKCHKLLAGGGPPGGGAPASPHTVAKLVRIAVCMRAHGISEFPDPRATMPANVSPAKYQVITDFDGAVLLFPATLNMQAPAYREALAACGAPPLGLHH